MAASSHVMRTGDQAVLPRKSCFPLSVCSGSGCTLPDAER